jgi:predicted RNA-binding protein with RPS1 domain
MAPSSISATTLSISKILTEDDRLEVRVLSAGKEGKMITLSTKMLQPTQVTCSEIQD